VSEHNGNGEAYHLKYRPATLDALVGQAPAVAMLTSMIEGHRLPRALMFVGPSGVGKTTAARCLQTALDCSDMDYREVNAANTRGIDTVRELEESVQLSPWGGGCKIYVLDEAHQLTRKKGGDAQTALLKTLEDTPSHVYWVLCTTDPGDLLPTIRTRCTEVKFGKVKPMDLEKLVRGVCKKERVKLDTEVIDRLVEVADGSARKCLVLLHQIVGVKGSEEQLECLQSSDLQSQTIDLCRALLNPRSRWGEVAKILKGLDSDPEEARRAVLGYATNVLLGGGPLSAKAYLILQAFRDNYYDSGRAGLVSSCYEVYESK
jgi:DNA polymerase III gamma/tau subunit